MKTISRRAWILYTCILAFLVGIGFLFYTFFTNADSWAMKKANRHLYDSGTLSIAGTVYDSTGLALAETKDGKRVYPKDKLIRTATLHTLGDAEGYIATGVQTSYKDTLTGYNFADGVYNLKKYGKGNDLHLTLNAELCATAYSALNGKKGTVGVMNYKTGELLCVVSAPSYDIQNKPTQNINNDKTGAYEGVYLNRFFSGVYTPGSTFKIITAISAIENIPDIYERTFTCDGEYEVDGGSVKCLHKHGKLGFEKALNQSCNSAFAELAIELGAEKLTATAQQLGLGAEGKIGNISLAKSTFDLSGASNLDVGWAGIGQYTTRVNPCGMLTLVGAIANGGAPAAPYFVDKIVSPTGRTLEKSKVILGEPMLSADTAEKMQKLLRSNVENYYGNGKFPNLKMCGKTGTAEVSSEDGGAKPHAWFVGYSSREDLPLAVVVVAENGGSASAVAIPIANTVMQKALKLYAK